MKSVTSLGFDKKVDYLLETIGPEVTASSVGLDNKRELSSWRKAKKEGNGLQRQQVNAMVKIVESITQTYPPTAAMNFLRGTPATLAGKTPSILIQQAKEEELEVLTQKVIDAAKY